MKEADRFTRLSIDVLMVEDEVAFVDLVTRMLADNRETEFRIHAVSTLAEAVDHCNENRPDATLLDLGLPDSKGLGTVRHFVERSATTALMILTALEDQHLAQEALALGAQEYLLKDAMTPDLLARAIRYAVDRQGLINQLRSAREAESRERELRRVERLASGPVLSATAKMYGNGPLASRAPDRVMELRAEYGRLLDEALDARVFDAPRSSKDDLRSMAGVLGYLGATPRDVINVHAVALRGKMTDTNYERGEAYLEEGRVMALELMGYLAAWYRSQALGQARNTSRGTPAAPGAAS